MKIGIFVGRFQTPKLHNGYKYMLSELQINYDYYGLILGSSLVPNNRNPLNCEIRKAMLEDFVFKNPLFIKEIIDLNNNDAWTTKLDEIITYSLNESNINYSKDDVYLIGSRDSFIPYYRGKFKTVQLEPFGNYNSTELRVGLRLNLINLTSLNFLSGFACGLVKKYFGLNFNWLRPSSIYNLDWSKGYIYCFK